VGQAQEMEIVELALFPPGGGPLIVAHLLIAQALESFALPSRLLIDATLLVAHLFQPREFARPVLPLLANGAFPEECKLHFGSSRACIQRARLLCLHLPHAIVDLIDLMTRARNQLVGGAQTQLLLMFHALAEVEHGFERKMKSHWLLTRKRY